ncbi:hypothetical protein ACWEWK_21770 [Streptomyces sp. NPDC003757]
MTARSAFRPGSADGHGALPDGLFNWRLLSQTHHRYERLEAVYRDVRSHTDAIYRRTYDLFG